MNTKTVKQIFAIVGSFIVIYYISTNYDSLKEIAKK